MTFRSSLLHGFSSMSRRGVALVLAAGLLAGAAHSDEEQGWPRELEVEAARVTVFEPQLESFVENRIQARAAVSVQLADSEVPVFGTAWFDARVDTDLDTRVVTLRSLEVPRVRFPEASEEQQASLVALLEEQIPTWDMDLSLDRLLAGIEALELRAQEQAQFNDAPPVILFTEEPTVLVSIEGPPKFWPIADSSLQSVVNSAFVIIQDREAAIFYLYAGNDLWYRASGLMGDWTVAAEVPDGVRSQQPPQTVTEPPAPGEGTPADATPPAILIAIEPTELIVTEGRPSYKPLGEGEVLYMANTDSDVLIETESQRHFVLLAGRWYASSGLEGPWTYVAADALPAAFAGIPEDSDMGHVLAWVSGTEMAREVAADAYLPQTSAIRRDATIEVSYDGEPVFASIEGTSLWYATNTSFQVIRSGASYYCASEGVWFVAPAATGPWSVATEVPDEIQDIPASSPVYNTKYIYVFESTPEVVYVGYYPGYVHCYYYNGCVVYGTGWMYPPYYGNGHYYPGHRTWGFHARYNPYTGWSFGVSWSNGPFTFTLGRAGLHGWFGPVGGYAYRGGYHHGYDRGWQQGFRQGVRAGYEAGQRPKRENNIYQHPGNRARNAVQAPGGLADRAGGAGPAGSRPGARPGTRPETAGPGTRPSPGAGRTDGPSAARTRPQTAPAISNNVYSDREGNVHRRTDEGTWQSREGGEWKSRDRTAGTTGRVTPSQQPARTQPTTRVPSSRPAQPSRQQSLERSHETRQRGTQRSRGASMSRSGGRGR